LSFYTARVKSVALCNGRLRLDFRYTLLATKLARRCNMSQWAKARSRCAPARCAGARAERPVADREDSGVKVSTINKRCVGVQHMIARGSCPHTAGRIIGRTDNTMTKIALTKARTSFLEYAVSIRLARN
jgi:hypothetical protein